MRMTVTCNMGINCFTLSAETLLLETFNFKLSLSYHQGSSFPVLCSVVAYCILAS